MAETNEKQQTVAAARAAFDRVLAHYVVIRDRGGVGEEMRRELAGPTLDRLIAAAKREALASQGYVTGDLSRFLGEQPRSLTAEDARELLPEIESLCWKFDRMANASKGHELIRAAREHRVPVSPTEDMKRAERWVGICERIRAIAAVVKP